MSEIKAKIKPKRKHKALQGDDCRNKLRRRGIAIRCESEKGSIKNLKLILTQFLEAGILRVTTSNRRKEKLLGPGVMTVAGAPSF